MFDTHCHLNFKSFLDREEEVVRSAKKVGVDRIVVPGTDLESSKKAVEIANTHEGIYAAVGIHPHHIFEIYEKKSTLDMFPFLRLLKEPKVVAVGEIGIDRHVYVKTKHGDYKVDEKFVDLQKEFFIKQIKIAGQYKKSLIIHNREAKKDVLEILTSHQSLIPSHSAVFHCCEPDLELLDFAKKHKMFIGVDGDITYYKEKQEWIKTVPLEMLVLETDSPLLSPFRKFPNEPKNIPFIAEFVSKLLNCQIDKIMKQTTTNAKILFGISKE